MGLHLALARGRVRVRVSITCACLLFMVCLSTPPRAQAFCRESTSSNVRPGDCDDGPGSTLLFWGRNCMTYVFNDALFAQVPMGEVFVRKTFTTSFQTWAGVQCTGSQTPFLVAQDPGTTSTTETKFKYDQPNESVIVLRGEGQWVGEDHSTAALALTLIWHDKKTGEILDVDMELNGDSSTFTDCKTTRCGTSTVDLQNTVTHEAGHLLGLGHSGVRGATMQPSTTMGPEVEKRDLAADDSMGYCALDLPDGPCKGANCVCPAPPVYASRRTVTTCKCHAPGHAGSSAGASGVGALMFASVWVWRRKRRRS